MSYQSYTHLREKDIIPIQLCKVVGRIEEHDVELSPQEEERAMRLHREANVIDLHLHLRVLPEDMRDREIYSKRGRIATGYEGVAKSGLTACFEGFGGNIIAHSSNSLWQFEDIIWDIGMRVGDMDHHKDIVMRGYCVDDILEAKRKGKTAVIPMIENGGVIYNDIERLEVLYGLGIRCMGLSFNYRSYIADGPLEDIDSGLSKFGYKVIQRMNRLGIIIDFSHSSDLTLKQGIEASEVPCILSHTIAKSLFNSAKGKSDEILELVAKHDGLIGIEAVPNITSNKEIQTVFDVIDHVDHVVKLVGVDHVAIGTDTLFGDHVGSHKASRAQGVEGGGKMVKEFHASHIDCIENPGQWPNITRALVARGYSDEDIKKIIGGNVLRFLERTIG